MRHQEKNRPFTIKKILWNVSWWRLECCAKGAFKNTWHSNRRSVICHINKFCSFKISFHFTVQSLAGQKSSKKVLHIIWMAHNNNKRRNKTEVKTWRINWSEVFLFKVWKKASSIFPEQINRKNNKKGSPIFFI